MSASEPVNTLLHVGGGLTLRRRYRPLLKSSPITNDTILLSLLKQCQGSIIGRDNAGSECRETPRMEGWTADWPHASSPFMTTRLRYQRYISIPTLGDGRDLSLARAKATHHYRIKPEYPQTDGKAVPALMLLRPPPLTIGRNMESDRSTGSTSGTPGAAPRLTSDDFQLAIPCVACTCSRYMRWLQS